MSEDVSSSLHLISQPLQGKLPAFPKLNFCVVDVRDVARAHIEAMVRPEANGERFICGGDLLWMEEVGDILREAFPDRKIPKGTLPSWLVRLFARVNPPLKQILPELDKQRLVSNEKAQRVLGVTFRPGRESILDGAQTLIDHKVV